MDPLAPPHPRRDLGLTAAPAGGTHAPAPGMVARAALTVERRASPAGGRTVATVLRSAPPLTLRRTGDRGDRGDRLTVHLVGSAAGPLGGDDLGLEVGVGPGARLDVRSVAAALAYPGPTGRPSHLAVTATVEAGAALSWRPEPTVLVAGCDHRGTTRVSLAAGATLVWQEVVVLGRHSEAPGSLLQRLRVDAGGRPFLRNDLAVGPRWPASLGPAGVHDARALGTAVLVGAMPDLACSGVLDTVAGARAAVLPLAEGAAMVSVLGPDATTVIAALDAVIGTPN